MSNSPMVSYTRISPNSNNPRNQPVTKITPHHMAGNLSLEALGNTVANPARQMSCNYGIDSAGRVGMYCEEKNRSWCSSSPANDHRAITIEVANDGGAPDWHVSDKAIAALIDLCVDICQRNSIPRLNFTGDATGNLTQHNYFAKTACPGPYLKSKFPYIAEQVNARLAGGAKETEAAPPAPEGNASAGGLYRVQVGAFKNKANAELYAEKVQKAGYQTVLTTQNGLHRVQLGAFKSKQNAEAYAKTVRNAGFEAVVVGESAKSDTASAPSGTAKVGSTVRLNKGAKTYTGGKLSAFVFKRNHVVSEIKGDRAVITYKGTTVAAVNVADLKPV